MRSSRPVKLKEQEQLIVALQEILRVAAVVMGLPVLVIGMYTLATEPLIGVLMVIAAMAALLYSADGLCQEPWVLGSILLRNNKENAYGAEQRD